MMTETNALLASFQDTPAMVNPGMQAMFEAFLHAAHVNLTRIEAATTKSTMQDDFWPAPDSWLAAYRPYTVKNGILMIPVKGVLLFGVGYAIGQYATGYIYLDKALERGLADPNVKGIALIVDSPGGHVAGNFDLADKIFAARGQKPIHAFAAENAYSAAYSIASACKTLTVARTGGVGSIGVVTMHLDVSKAMDKAGLKMTFIHYGQHKVDGNGYEALPADVKDRIQARIDGLGELFVSTVARNRKLDAQAVRDTEALTFDADEALTSGLADKIGSLDDATANFAAYLSTPEEESMTTKLSVAPIAASVQTPSLSNADPALRAVGTPRRSPLVVQAPPISRAEQAMRDSGYAPRSPMAVQEPTLSRAEQAMRDAGYPPRSPMAAASPSIPAAPPVSTQSQTMSKADRALLAAGYKPKPEASNPGEEQSAQMSKAERALRAAGFEPRKQVA
ncbi:S49 family peptidase [Rhizobium sp. KDH_Rht_773_N]